MRLQGIIKLPSIKIQLIIFLTVFAIFIAILEKSFIFLFSIFVAVVAALISDSALNYINPVRNGVSRRDISNGVKARKFAITDSSVISGLIIGLVISSGSPLWIIISAAFLAIASKHILIIDKRHIFNPAALGVFIVTVLFGASTQWHGAYIWYILIPAGLYFITKIRRLELLLSYFLISVILFGIQAIILKTPFLGIFGYLNYFFIFIMLIEPKTTPAQPAKKILFGSLVAILVFILTNAGVRFDVELFSLLTLNLSMRVIGKLTDSVE